MSEQDWNRYAGSEVKVITLRTEESHTDVAEYTCIVPVDLLEAGMEDELEEYVYNLGEQTKQQRIDGAPTTTWKEGVE